MGYTGGPEVRPAHAEVDGLLCPQDADAQGPLQEDFALAEEGVALVDAGLEDVHELGHAVGEVVGHVAGKAADAEVAVHHARAADGFEELLDMLALNEAVHEGRSENAHILAVGAVEHHMAADAVELAEDDPDELRPLRHGEAHQLLGGHTEDELVVEVGQVVQAVEQGDDLAVVLPLAELLRAPVQVADDRLEVHHPLTIHAEDHAEHAVGRRVLRPHIDQHVHRLEVLAQRPRRRGQAYELGRPLPGSGCGGHQACSCHAVADSGDHSVISSNG